ncbi:MAG: esterase, partial [Bacteroidota bacterium]|nr:esterase [Bacteroidota bacterium]
MMNDVRADTHISVTSETLFSLHLNRDVLIDVYLPPTYSNTNGIDLLLINDGQDLPLMPFADLLSHLYSNDAIEPLLCVGIHCGTDRK